MIKGIIFDADGTIFESMHIWTDLGERYLKTKDIAAENGLGKILACMSLEQSSSYLKEKYGITDTAEKIAADTVAMIEDIYRNEVELKPGFENFLKEMKVKSVALGIATAGDKKLVKSVLERYGIEKYFSVILSCSDLKTDKHNPDIYLKAAEFMGTKPEETAVFEDSLFAIKTAKKAGFLTVAAEDDYSASEHGELKNTADYYIRDFYDTEIDKIRKG